MKTERNILIAFLLNLGFSVFEFFGGAFTGSVAIISDAMHDMGDALSIGISYFLEKKSKKQANSRFTYGYGRCSVLGGLITSVILLLGSGFMIYNAICKIITPQPIHYNGMILFAIVGVLVNSCAAFFTREKDSFNQRAVNLHMLEDVLGWVVVLIGAIVMKFTDFRLIDPILSIGVSIFILIQAARNLKDITELFLERVPRDIDTQQIINQLLALPGVQDIHHIHIWSIDGQNHSATMHVVTNSPAGEVKARIREELLEHHIAHVTLELEAESDCCNQRTPFPYDGYTLHHHHHHHHHHTSK